ncbi:hypothetical protein Rhopal_000404-T1 [Rhodotorula paludigena]|uniref:Uncharacterized protein n=1 Tax=Rhodotorula paludigena TaxID=86838 RepID=A0AAV5G523_9BASI|nr:hypothetical protein Rhopal_000404-T1 [Rhodotorula paludigena]
MSSSLKRSSSPSLATPPSAKKARVSTLTAAELLDMDEVDLATLSPAELVHAVTQLKETLSETMAALDKEKKKKAPLATASGNAQAQQPEWTDEQVKAKAKQVADLALKGIKPTCKKGTTKWSYTGVVPRHDVFYTLFGFGEPKTKSKMWKQKKLEMDDFEKAIGCISVSIRYGSLSVTGKTVMLHWDAENSQFTLKGTYGLPY